LLQKQKRHGSNAPWRSVFKNLTLIN